MSDTYSLVVENAREEVLSSDLIRMETLGQTQILDQGRDQARTDDTPVYDADFGATKGDRAGVNGASLLPILTPAAGFQMNLGQFQILVDDGGSGSGLNNESSSNKVFRFGGATLTFAVPDATNPRIDLVVMEDGTQNTDLQSRNILLDPVARTVASQIVPKRQNPQCVINVLTGTPGVVPVPLAPGAGQIAIFEVLVPAAALLATEFSTSRTIFRRIEFPGAAAHGILQGCQLSTSSVAETTSAQAQIRSGTAIGSAVNKVIIDGEVIAFHAGVSGTSGFEMFAQDTVAPPVAAPGTNDAPYYIYACGGRHLQQGRLGIPWGGNPTLEPICLVESLTPPDINGRPSIALGTPRGPTQAGAVYVGVGWIVKGSVRRKCVRYSGDWAYANNGSFYEDTIVGVPTAPAFTDVTLLSCPITSDQMDLRMYAETAATVPNFIVLATKASQINIPIVFINYLWVQELMAVGTPYLGAQERVFFRSGIAPQLAVRATLAADADANFRAYGFNMNVRRYGSF